MRIALAGVLAVALFGCKKARAPIESPPDDPGRPAVVVPDPAEPEASAGPYPTASYAELTLTDTAVAVSPGGDIDGDGRADLLLGLPDQGRVHVLFGSQFAAMRAGGSPSYDRTLESLRPGDRLGASLIGVGDVDGDGLGDVIASYPPNLAYGAAFVVFGKRDTRPVRVSGIAAASGVLGIVGASDEAACSVVASGVDANGDGLDDLLLSALFYPGATQAAGGAYVAFGWDVTGALAGREHVLVGSSEDNVLDLPSSALVVARGGNGSDTLRVGPDVRELDLRLPGRYDSIEVVDVRGNGPQTLRLDDAALRRIPQNQVGFAFMLARKLTVLGDAEDQLEIGLDGYSARPGSAGRVVYGRPGSYYGLEVSRELPVVAPPTSSSPF